MAYPDAETRTGIPYTVQWTPESSIQEQWGDGANQTTVVLSTAWETAAAFLDDILGKSERVGSRITRTTPAANPWANAQYAVEANLVKAWGNPKAADGEPPADEGSENWPELTAVNYAVTFRSLMYDVKEDDDIEFEWERFCEFNYQEKVEALKVPGGAFRFVTGTGPGGQIADSYIWRGVATLGIRVLWRDVPEIPWANIRKCSGKVNSGVLFEGLDGGDGYIAESVRLDSWRPVRRITAAGRRTWDIEYNLSAIVANDVSDEGITWNKFYSKQAGKFLVVTTDGAPSGRKPYLSEDLNLLFAFA